MSTPHNKAEKGDIAKVVLMPGDPLRAKVLADTYLKDAKQFNDVRGMNGYTGTYKGHRISVMGSGMGMPSIGIYSYELYKFYDVEVIIRIGSTGSMVPEVKIYDVILATSAYSRSTYAYNQSGDNADVQYPDDELCNQLRAGAKELGYELKEGCIHSSDNFYYEDSAPANPKLKELNCLAVEMESFALYHNAKVLGKKAACLLTVSDSLVTHEVTTAEERQNSFTRMMEIALSLAGKYED